MPVIDIHTHNIENEADTFVYNIRFGCTQQNVFAPLYSVGIHPWDADVDINDEFYTLAEKAVAIGECGLDKACKTPMEKQQQIFSQQIEIAQDMNKPVIIHCVRCWGQILEMSHRYANHTPWLIHGCYASAEWIRQASRHNFFFSLGPKQIGLPRFAEILQAIPPSRLLLETDDDKSMNIRDVYAATNANERQIEGNYEQFIGRSLISR
ncbi:MAG: TatD family hydrolase [Bacteroidales bacterium]|nr:TatD family hydrolase [Bacteroidales bacterium]